MFLNSSFTDKRLEHLPLNGPPTKMLILVATYLLIVHKIGPWFMKNRRPFELKSLMAAYNLLQIALNAIVIVYVRAICSGELYENVFISSPRCRSIPSHMHDTTVLRANHLTSATQGKPNWKHLPATFIMRSKCWILWTQCSLSCARRTLISPFCTSTITSPW